MKWAEVIMMRAAGSRETVLAAALKELIREVPLKSGHTAIRVFRREKLDSDICIVLFHGSEKTETGGSPLGLRIAAALKEVGLVNHTIWNELER